MTTKERYHDIDWLRVLGMLTIFLFHTARFFNEDDWHVKNFETDFGMTVFVAIVANFIMPLFFVLSAMAIYHALVRRTSATFMRERVNRLLVPFVVGIFSHVALQVYIERVTHDEFTGSFLRFIPHYFDGFYAFGGNFAWMGLHLWYLLMLFLFSWMMLSTFLLIRRSEGFTRRLAAVAATPLGVYLAVIPLFVMEALVDLSPGTVGRRQFGGWSPFSYLVFFVIGYLLVTDPRYRPTIQKMRFVSLALAVLSVAISYVLLVEMDLSDYSPAYALVRAVNSWSWLLAFLGFAGRYLDFSNDFLKYANRAVLPFYILHQTVVVVVGFFIRDWRWAVLPKYLFLAAVSFAVIMVLYEFVVRRIGFMRVLFGMK